MNDTASHPPCLSCGAERMADQPHYCEPIITNLRCWNCDLSLSPTKSQYEKDDYRCPGCDRIQINKTINIGDNEYIEYLAGYHNSPFEPLSREKYKEIKNYSNTAIEFKCLDCGHNQFNADLNNHHIYKCENCNLLHEENPPGIFSIVREKKFRPTHSPNPKDQIGQTKLPLHLIPPPALARLSKVLELGAKKYGPYNWRETEVNLTVYLTAALRHIYSILDGEDIDPESNQHHAAHFMACAAIILDAIEVGKLIDDRSLPGNFAHLVIQLQEKKS